MEFENAIQDWLGTSDELSVVRSLIESIREKSVLLYGQWIYDKDTHRIDKIEVLARLKSESGVLAPFVFLPLLKNFWLETDFDMLMFEKTLEFVSRSPYKDISYSVNLHKSTLNDDTCHSVVRGLMDEFRIRSGRIIFEILEEDVTSGCRNSTELLSSPKNAGSKSLVSEKCGVGFRPPSCIGDSYDKLSRNIMRYKGESGIEFSVDDFPMGTNCIHNVRKMNGVDYVKIDGIWLLSLLENFKKSFVNGEQVLLKTFSGILAEIRKTHPDVTFVVERMENHYLFELFKQVKDIRYFQGYFFSVPKNLSEATDESVRHNLSV